MFDLAEHQRKVYEEAYWLERRGMNPVKAMNWAFANVAHGISSKPKAVVEYAHAQQLPSVDPGASIARFYDDCRASAKNSNTVFVGD